MKRKLSNMGEILPEEVDALRQSIIEDGLLLPTVYVANGGEMLITSQERCEAILHAGIPYETVDLGSHTIHP